MMPALTTAPLNTAEAGIGAAACASGIHTCSGTRPALSPKPTISRATISSLETRPTLRVAEVRVPDWSGPAYQEARSESDWAVQWAHALRQAEQGGRARLGSALIDYAAGELFVLDTSRFGVELAAGITRAAPDGFVVVLRPRGTMETLPVLGYGLDGKVRWRAVLRSTRDHPDHVGPFSPVGADWRDGELRVFGARFDSLARTSDVGVLSASVSQIADQTASIAPAIGP